MWWRFRAYVLCNIGWHKWVRLRELFVCHDEASRTSCYEIHDSCAYCGKDDYYFVDA